MPVQHFRIDNIAYKNTTTNHTDAMHKIKYIISVFLTLVSFCINAANHKTISSADGLSNSAILCMYQDDLGHIYLGTTDGLNIWNGHEVNTFQAQDGYNYFFGNLITNIYPFGENHIYVRTLHGAASVNTQTNEVEFFRELALGRPIFQDEEYILILDKNFNLQVFDLRTKELSQNSNAFIPKSVSHRMSLRSQDGRLCIFTDKDIYLVSMEKHGNDISISEIANLGVTCRYISPTHNGTDNYFMTGDNRLCSFSTRDHSITEISRIDSMPKDIVTGIQPSKDGYYISFIKTGLFFLRNGNRCLEPTEIKSGIFSMIPDKVQPIIWIGTDCKGLIRYNTEERAASCITYDELPYAINMPVRSVFVDEERVLWFGTKGDGLFRIKDFENATSLTNENVQKFDTANSQLTDNNVFSITGSSHGFIWFGSDGRGLNFWSYRNRRIEKVSGSETLSRVHSIVEENDSTLWVATDGYGAFKCTYRMRGGVPVITEITLPDFCEPFNKWTSIFSVAIQNDSTIWFGSRQNGILEYKSRSGKSRVLQFPTDKGLAINETFYISKSDKMLFATGNGLVAYCPEKQTFQISEDVPQRATHGIVCDNKKNVWVSTNSGIVSLDSAFNYRLSFNRFSDIDILEYSDGACYYDKPGNLVIFGGINGITIIRNYGKLSSPDQNYTPKIVLTHFIQNNNCVPIIPKIEKERGKLKIPYSRSLFGIKFSVVDHLNYQDYEFRYNIEGYNSEWVTNNSDIIYIQTLEPGRYKLKIVYVNKATGYMSEECVLPINILPPFYRTWCAYCIYLLLIIGTVYIAIRHNQQKYNSMKEKIRKKYIDELNNISYNTTSTINEELSVQLTFIIGLCQQIRQTAQNSPYMADKVNLVEYNIAKINKTLHMFNEYKEISEAMINSAEATFILVSQTASEVLGLMRNFIKVRNVSLTYNIEDGIITALNKEAFLTMLYSLIYKAISIAKGQKKVHIDIERGENDGVTLKIVLTTESNITEEEGDDFLLCRRLVKVMNGHISMNFDNNEHELRIRVILPSMKSCKDADTVEDIDSLITENIHTYNSFIENQLPKNFKSDIHPDYIYIVSNNRDISSFLGYFLSDSYNILSFTDNASAIERIGRKAPVAVIYDVSSLHSGLTDFLEAIKVNKIIEHVITIALTSSLQTTEREEYAKLGADMCISFPFNMSYLRTALEKLQQKQKSVSEYYKSPRSSFTIDEGKVIHQEDKEFIANILKAIEENISNPDLTAPVIADQIGISTRVMYRRMENITDKKLHQIIRETRMTMAATLLSSSKLNIDEIMYTVGYDNRSTFYRNFKDIYGKTPREYREQMYRDMLKDLTLPKEINP